MISPYEDACHRWARELPGHLGHAMRRRQDYLYGRSGSCTQAGQNVVVVDFDVGLRNLDLVLGVERRIVYDLTDVVQDITKLPQSLISDRRIPTLSLLPASQTRDKDALTEEGVGRVISSLRETFDWVICDSPAGIERGALCAMRFADAAVIVTNPQVSSIRDSNQIIGMLNSKTQKSENGGRIEQHLLITRYDPVRATRDEMLSIEDVLEFLPVSLLGVIPESEEVLRAFNVGSPITLSNKRSAAARAYIAAAKKLNNGTVGINMDVKRSLIDKLFGRKAA